MNFPLISPDFLSVFVQKRGHSFANKKNFSPNSLLFFLPELSPTFSVLCFPCCYVTSHAMCSTASSFSTLRWDTNCDTLAVMLHHTQCAALLLVHCRLRWDTDCDGVDLEARVADEPVAHDAVVAERRDATVARIVIRCRDAPDRRAPWRILVQREVVLRLQHKRCPPNSLPVQNSGFISVQISGFISVQISGFFSGPEFLDSFLVQNFGLSVINMGSVLQERSTIIMNSFVLVYCLQGTATRSQMTHSRSRILDNGQQGPQICRFHFRLRLWVWIQSFVLDWFFGGLVLTPC